MGMPYRLLLCFTLLLTLFIPCAAQSDSKTPAPEQAAPERAEKQKNATR
jgi:hypothetical protein